MEVEIYKPIGMSMVQLVNQYKQEHNIENQTVCYTNRLDELARGYVHLIITDNHVDTISIQQKYNSMNKAYRFFLISDLLTDTDEILGLNESCNAIPFDQSVIVDAINAFPNKFLQKYHKFSSFRPLDVFDEGKRQPMWFFSMRGIEIKNRPTKPVQIFTRTILNIIKIPGYVLKQEIISRITQLKIDTKDRNKLREVDIQLQWESYDFKEEYTLIQVELAVSSGFYIRQFARDLYDITQMKVTVFDIERVRVF